MLDARFYRFLGFFTEPEFLRPDDCASLREEIRRASHAPAGLMRGQARVVDSRRRSCKVVDVSERARALVEARLAEARGAIQAHFGLHLRGWQQPQFLRYEPGDFFAPHTDAVTSDAAADVMKERRVSAVISLSGGDAASEGGVLRFMDVIDDPRLADRAFAVRSAPGMLIAFRSELRHEVTPVRSGERHSVVTWFY